MHDNLLPFVSIILPIRNEIDYIDRTLEAVFAQDYPHTQVETIVVDGMSDDGTREYLAALQKQGTPFPLQVIDNPAQIVPHALNTALPIARGEVIVRVDGHCEIAPDYLRRCVHHLQTRDIAGVGGPITTIGETFTAQAIAVGMSTPFGVGGSAFRTLQDETRLVDTVAFPAYTRTALEQAGPFDEELVRNQDDEYNYRLRKMGYKILLAPDVKSRYYSRSALRSLWCQYFQYGYWKVRVLQKHPRQMSLRQFIPPIFVASLLGSLGLAVIFPWGWRLLLLAGGAYLTANLAASLWAARQHGWRFIWLLPLVYAVLHLAYGAGFLAGLLRFAPRWNISPL